MSSLDADPRIAALRRYAHDIETPEPTAPSVSPARPKPNIARAARSVLLIVATVIPLGIWQVGDDLRNIGRARHAIMGVSTSAPIRIVAYEDVYGACGRYRNDEGVTLRFYENDRDVWVERTPGRWFTPSHVEGWADDAYDRCAVGRFGRGRALGHMFTAIALALQG